MPNYFYVQDQGVFIPTDDLAQAFAAINFVQTNSLGVGTDTLTPVVNSDNPNWIVDIRTQDLWGFAGAGSSASIYRLTNVGIGTSVIFERFQVGGTGEDLVVTSLGFVGIGTTIPTFKLDVNGNLHVVDEVEFDSTLDVDGATTLNATLDVDGATTLNDTLDVDGATTLNATLDVDGATTLNDTLDVDGATTLNATLDVDGATTLNDTLDVDGATTLNATLDVDGDVTFNSTTSSTDKDTGSLIVDGGVGIEENLNVGNDVTISGTTSSTDKDTGSLIVDGGVGIEENLNVGGNTKLIGTIELDSSLIDINGETAGPGVGKTDYRLASVGTGVSWRPAGVETQNTIWVTKDGNDSNTGLLEGDAKATVGAAAAVAEPGDTIVIRPGVYTENNPIGLRTDVTVTGQDLRLVTIRPLNVTKDVFHVRRGCLIENINFAGSSVSSKSYWLWCCSISFN
jgi:hypothetical protein